MNVDEAYKVLGLDQSATEDDVKKATRKLMAKYHPDRCKDSNAETLFKRVGEASRVITDSMNGNVISSPWENRSGVPGWENSGPTMNADFFDDIFGSGFANPFRRRSTHTRVNTQQMVNPDIRISVDLTFKEAILGTTKEIEYDIKAICPECGGIGQKQTSQQCLICHGKGTVTHNSTMGHMTISSKTTCETCRGSGKMFVQCDHCKSTGFVDDHVKGNITIPSGVVNGAASINHGMGNGSLFHPNMRGSLIITFNVAEDLDYVRYGDDIHLIHHISLLDSLKGRTIEIDDLKDVKHFVKIPECIKNTDLIKVSNDGVPATNGSFYMKVLVDYPKNSESINQLIKLLEEEENNEASKEN